MASNPYSLQGNDDFVRLDNLCHTLLREFVVWLQHLEEDPVAPEGAGALAHAADRYLRDFMVDIKETGPADTDPALVLQYLGNWYIINTLEPSHEEIDHIAGALDRLYRFLSSRDIVNATTAARVRQHLDDRGFFHRRLDAFWELTPETISSWRQMEDFRAPCLKD